MGMFEFAGDTEIGTIDSMKNTVSSTIVAKVIVSTIQLALTLFTGNGQNAICPCGDGRCGSTDSMQCTNVTCLENYFNNMCPAIFKAPFSGLCSFWGSLSAGHSSLIASAHSFLPIYAFLAFQRPFHCSTRDADLLAHVYAKNCHCDRLR